MRPCAVVALWRSIQLCEDSRDDRQDGGRACTDIHTHSVLFLQWFSMHTWPGEWLSRQGRVKMHGQCDCDSVHVCVIHGLRERVPLLCGNRIPRVTRKACALSVEAVKRPYPLRPTGMAVSFQYSDATARIEGYANVLASGSQAGAGVRVQVTIDAGAWRAWGQRPNSNASPPCPTRPRAAPTAPHRL